MLEGLGAAISFHASIETLGFHMKCLSEDLERVAALLAEMIMQPSFPEDEWQIVRSQMLNAIRETRQDTYDRAYYRAMELLCGADNPYARYPMGGEESLAGIETGALARLHAETIAARSLTIAAVGDLEGEAGLGFLKRIFGSLPPGRAYPAAEEGRRWTGFEPPPGLRADHIELPEKFQVDMIFARPGLSRADKAYDAAFVANYLLGGHFSSRLCKQLRDNEGLTYSVYSRLRPGLGRIPLYISIGVHPENCERAREGVLREMERLGTGGVPQDEFDDALSHLTGSFPVRLESNRAVADMLLDGERYGHGPDVIENYVERLGKIRKAEVEIQASRLFVPDPMVMASAGTLKPAGGSG
jgi:zinc protease